MDTDQNHGCFPVIIGISGHREIAPEALDKVRSSLEGMIGKLQRQFKDQLFVATGLAEGADQLAAAVAEKLTIPHIAILPMDKNWFHTTISTDPRYPARLTLDRYWENSRLRVELPWLGPQRKEGEKLQYEQLGAVLSRFSHILIALSDGVAWPIHNPQSEIAWERDQDKVRAEQEKQRGGTSHVVHLRRNGEFSADEIRNSPIFKNSLSPLDLVEGGPIVHILTPRAKSPLPLDQVGTVTLSGAGTIKTIEDLTRRPRDANKINDANNFIELFDLNYRINEFNAFYVGILKRQIGGLGLEKTIIIDRAARIDLDYLCKRQAAADTAAQYYQHRLLGEAPITATWWPRLRHFLGGLICQGHFANPGMVISYAVLVMLGVVSFETYSEVNHSPLFLVVYAVVVVSLVSFHRQVVNRHRWQNHFQDYRALAEAMRVQIFWALGGIPSAVADHYMRKQKDELGWIAFALRGPALWSLAVALKYRARPDRETIRNQWLEDQQRYFEGTDKEQGKRAKNHAAYHRTKAYHDYSFYAALYITVLLTVGALIVWILAKPHWLNAHRGATHMPPQFWDLYDHRAAHGRRRALLRGRKTRLRGACPQL